MRVVIQSHGFFCYPEGDLERTVLDRFAGRFIQTEKSMDPRTKQIVENVKAYYGTLTADKNEYGFLRRALPEFEKFMSESGFGHRVKYEQKQRYTPSRHSDMNIVPPFAPRGQQSEALAYAIADALDRTIEAATGFGKTITAFFVMDHFKERTAVVMGATHIPTWTSCGSQYMGMGPGDVMVIKGSASLKGAVKLARDGMLYSKVLLFSAETIRNFIKEYEDIEPSTYDFTPHELWELLGVGRIFRDESHEAIESSVKQVIYSNVPNITYLSATLVSDNSYINKIYDYIFGKKKERWKSDNNKHIAVRPLFHMMNRYLLKKGFRYKGPRGYSHVLYEKHILKRKRVLKQYLDFIEKSLHASYFKRYEPGMKAIVLCSSIPMCETIKKFFSEKYPSFTFGGFYDGAKKEELYERDVVISTPKGAGTGKDIPGLGALIQTIAVNSVQLNLQIMGRLRPVELLGVKRPDIEPLYIYFVNNDIPQHRAYHNKRLQDVADKCKDIKIIYSNFYLGQDAA
ncbi:helicase [Vibrio phage BONAISHI]|nr:helicase [Vibrio phage BONAISHI]